MGCPLPLLTITGPAVQIKRNEPDSRPTDKMANPIRVRHNIGALAANLQRELLGKDYGHNESQRLIALYLSSWYQKS